MVIPPRICAAKSAPRVSSRAVERDRADFRGDLRRALSSADARARASRSDGGTSTTRAERDRRAVQVEPDAYLLRLECVAGGLRPARTADCGLCGAPGDARARRGTPARRDEVIRRHRTAHIQ